MKKQISQIVLFLFFSLMISKGMAQVPIIDNTILKKGIYSSFEDFRNNDPSYPLEHDIVEDEYGYKISKYETFDYYRVDIFKKEGKKYGSIFGVSDGKDAYICAKGDCKLKFSTNLYMLEAYGRYCLFQKVVSSGGGVTMDSQGKFNNYGGSSSISLVTMAIDINTGNIFRLNAKVLLEILERDPELLADFMEEDSKNEVLGYYLEMFSDRHPEEIIE